MTPRLLGFLAIAFAVTTGVTTYVVSAANDYRDRHAGAPSVSTASGGSAMVSGPRLVFRHTGIDRSYGMVAVVPLEDPAGARVFADVACDRVDATATAVSCLRTEPGVVTRFELDELDADWDVRRTVALPGAPSRTRLSEDGTLLATTTFVTGHSYMQTGFSTATEIREVGGASYGNLERWRLVVGGAQVAPVDRNLWGVTFADDTLFYATAATGGETYLVRGDLTTRTLTAVAEHVECPSLSPEGTRVAFKQARRDGGRTHWTPAVLDLATGKRTVLAGEERNVDDQIEWLDEDTILYGVPRAEEPGVSDVWALDTAPGARPRLLVEQAWSPAVVR